MTKLIYILPAAVIMLCALYGGAISVGLTQNPFKVTDPSDPRFDPDQFSFTDYERKEDLEDAFRKLFPPGTPKEFIDRVLVKAGRANISRTYEASEIEPKYILVTYEEPSSLLRTIKKPFFHHFVLDNNYQILNVQAFGNRIVFKDLPDRMDFNEMKQQNIMENKND